MKELLKIYYFSSTHWDREWYRSFQGFRYRLVKITDEIIEVLENDPSFSSFTFDGQTIVLDDYCQIKPENRKRLESLIEKGRINVGPWYVMPDEFLCSGESLIKNLQMGHKMAKDFNAPSAMKFGYICDIFGHIGQMPQIFNGFGIKAALLGRGTNDKDTPAFFKWESYDGSNCITFKVPEECGYGTFWLDVWSQYNNGSDTSKENIVKRAVSYIEAERMRADLPYVVLMDAMDHTSIQPLAPWLAKELENIYKCTVVFESLENLADSIKPYADSMAIHKGELNKTAQRHVEHNMLIPYTLSSRYDLKKQNDLCQILLEKWCNPLLWIASQNDNSIPTQYLEEAYHHLISCHPHDSICGCSIDSVHEDMHYRFRQVTSIAEEIIFDALTRDIIGVENSLPQDKLKYILSVFNTLPYRRDEEITVEINLPCDYQFTYYEQAPVQKINSFKIFDINQKEIEYTLIDIKRNQFVNVYDSDYRKQMDVITVSFSAILNSLGKTEYYIIPSKTPSRFLKTMSLECDFAENDWIKLTINSNGTLELYDKITKTKYPDLLYFLDDAEIGDGWFHVNPLNDSLISSKGFTTGISKIVDGPTCSIFRIIKSMIVPESIANTNEFISRSQSSVVLEITTDVKITSTSHYLDISTKINNTAKDHRVRLCIPTGIKDGTYFAGQAFTVVERTCGLDFSTNNWKECDKREKAFDGFVWKHNENNGLAFISEAGLHECAAQEGESGNFLITLYRSFSKTFLTNGEKGGQLTGELSFKYRIVPTNKNDTFADIIRLKDSFQTGIKAYTYPTDMNYSIQNSSDLLVIHNRNIVLSTMRPPLDKSINGLMIRIYNSSDNNLDSDISCHANYNKCEETNLLEEKLNEIEMDNDTIKLSFRPFEIKTVIFSRKAKDI